jgi:hypothetical protein
LVGQLARAAGLTQEKGPITPQELCALFSWDKLPKEDLIAQME